MCVYAWVGSTGVAAVLVVVYTSGEYRERGSQHEARNYVSCNANAGPLRCVYTRVYGCVIKSRNKITVNI